MNPYIEMLSRILEQSASEAEINEFAAEVRKNPELRRESAQILQIHGNLGVVMKDQLTRESWRDTVMNEVVVADRDAFRKKVHGKVLFVHWSRRITSIAAVLAIIAAAGFLMKAPRLAPEEGVATAPAATLMRMEKFDANTELASSFQANRIFRIGDVIQMGKGLMELELDGCGSLVVEGPAHLSFPEARRAVLKYGRVVMKATVKGQGYRIDTPMGGIIDLGTEFGVSVDQAGNVETHVLDGHVETVANSGNRQILHQDEALRFLSTGEERIPANASKFYTMLPPVSSNNPNYVHWSMDQIDSQWIDATSRGLGGSHPEMTLRNVVGGNLPELADGIFGNAIQFDGKGAYLESGFRGIGGGNPRTVCMWVKTDLPTDFRHGYGILSWGRYQADRPGEAWQISVNTYKQDGPTGRLRVGLHEGQVIGSTDLRDGKWHHIAVVLYGGSNPDVGTHVLLYVDGQLETITARALRKVETDVENADRGVWVGRNMVTTKEGEPYGNWEYFRGNVDELYIFDAALSHSQILDIMERNAPPG